MTKCLNQREYVTPSGGRVVISDGIFLVFGSFPFLYEDDGKVCEDEKVEVFVQSGFVGRLTDQEILELSEKEVQAMLETEENHPLW